MNALTKGLLIAVLLNGSLHTIAFSRTGAQPNCDDDELVDLYPGYPGFRGYLPDTVGALDWVCPEDLPRRFDPDEEDEDNERSADRLDIRGSKEDWTWENWMAIESERGLPSTCFTCVIFYPSEAPVYEPERRVDRERDPRYIIGSISGQSIALRWADSIGGNTASILRSAPTDLQLKVLSGMVAAGDYITAQEVVDLSEEILDLLFCIEKPCFQFDTSKLCRGLFDQSGYAPTPEEATIDDQIFMMTAGFFGLSFLWPGSHANQMQVMLSHSIQEWQMELMSDVRTPSLGEWLRDNGAAGWC